jgi:hypothetical protein
MAPYGENLGSAVDGRCELCGRRVGEEALTRHHLLPRSYARKKYDARKTLEAFSAKLRDETDLDALSDDLIAGRGRQVLAVYSLGIGT